MSGMAPGRLRRNNRHMKLSIPPTILYLLTIFLVVTTCDTDSPTPFECEKGFLPCEEDTTVCCEVICPENHHLCGPDSIDCCFDTPSHEFQWNVDTIGTKGWLRDVTIIDDNNIWVVGEFYTPDPDSSFNGTGWKSHNAAHWTNGKWIYYRILKGAPINTIWAFSENDIWGSNGVPIHWDGNEWKLYNIQKLGIPAMERSLVRTSIWGSSSSNMYFGGVRGDLVHYDGSTFQKIDISTNDPITDIWGIIDEETGEQTVYGTVSYLLHSTDKKIFKLDGRNMALEALNWPGGADLLSIWFDTNSPIYTAGTRLRRQHPDSSNWERVMLKNKYMYSVRGNHKNDIFVSGWQLLYHYNGIDWYEYTNLPNSLHLKSLKKVALKDNVVSVIGWPNYVLTGKRKGK